MYKVILQFVRSTDCKIKMICFFVFFCYSRLKAIDNVLVEVNTALEAGLSVLNWSNPHMSGMCYGVAAAVLGVGVCLPDYVICMIIINFGMLAGLCEYKLNMPVMLLNHDYAVPFPSVNVLPKL